MASKQFRVTSTETLHRTYIVQADDEKDARRRLNLHWDDPELLREGIVKQTGSEDVGSRKAVKVEPQSNVRDASPRGASES